MLKFTRPVNILTVVYPVYAGDDTTYLHEEPFYDISWQQVREFVTFYGLFDFLRIVMNLLVHGCAAHLTGENVTILYAIGREPEELSPIKVFQSRVDSRGWAA